TKSRHLIFTCFHAAKLRNNPQYKPVPELRIYLSIGVYSILAPSSVASTRFEDGNLNFLHNSELSVSQFGCKVIKTIHKRVEGGCVGKVKVAAFPFH
ncbi:MAG: hypothetical protein J6T22_13360, partial [Bacteroidales bacterium]|nr:hypothetical protein [Bacteroidales bacterium]